MMHFYSTSADFGRSSREEEITYGMRRRDRKVAQHKLFGVSASRLPYISRACQYHLEGPGLTHQLAQLTSRFGDSDEGVIHSLQCYVGLTPACNKMTIRPVSRFVCNHMARVNVSGGAHFASPSTFRGRVDLPGPTTVSFDPVSSPQLFVHLFAALRRMLGLD